MVQEQSPENPFHQEQSPENPFRQEQNPEYPFRQQSPENPFRQEQSPEYPFRKEQSPEYPFVSTSYLVVCVIRWGGPTRAGSVFWTDADRGYELSKSWTLKDGWTTCDWTV